MIVEDEHGNEYDLRDLDDDREPEPPEPEEEQPLDLDELAATLTDALGDPGELGQATAEVLAAVPDLIAELRRTRDQVAYWRGLEEDTVYASAHGGEQTPDDCHMWVHHRDGEAADRSVEAAAGAATAYMRTRTLHPWVELAEAPF